MSRNYTTLDITKAEDIFKRHLIKPEYTKNGENEAIIPCLEVEMPESGSTLDLIIRDMCDVMDKLCNRCEHITSINDSFVINHKPNPCMIITVEYNGEIKYLLVEVRPSVSFNNPETYAGTAYVNLLTTSNNGIDVGSIERYKEEGLKIIDKDPIPENFAMSIIRLLRFYRDYLESFSKACKVTEKFRKHEEWLGFEPDNVTVQALAAAITILNGHEELMKKK